MTDTPCLPDDISRQTREHFRNLPKKIEESRLREAQKKKAARNRYMNRYMTDVYWKENSRLTVSLSSDRRRFLDAKATELGMKPTTALREAAFAHFDAAPLYPRDVLDRLAEATLEIRRIGTNINQIARNTNRDQYAAFRENHRCLELLERLEQSLTRILAPPTESEPEPPAAPAPQS